MNYNYQNLNDKDKKIFQPENISIELFESQKTAIYTLTQLEDDKTIIYNEYGNIYTLNTNKLIYCDRVGSGKTLTIIGLQSIKKNVLFTKAYESYNYLSFEITNKRQYSINTDLVIVPNILINQWKDTYNNYCSNLSVLVIDNEELLNKLLIRNWKTDHVNSLGEVVMYINKEPKINNDKLIFEEYDVVLMTDKIWLLCFEIMYKIFWRRVIIDEADTVQYPSDDVVDGKIIIYITGTPDNILNSNSNYFSSVFDSRVLINKLKVFNNNEYINKSINLPKPNRIKIKCITPLELNIIYDIISPQIIQMINAGNSEEALKQLNCDMNTSDNIIKILVNAIDKEIDELEYELKQDYSNSKKKEIKDKLKQLYLKTEKIKSRILNYKDEICPICFDEFEIPCIMNCCNTLFCSDCLLLASSNSNKCPNCSSIFNKKNMKIINDENKKDKNEINEINDINSPKEKMQVMIDILELKKDKYIIIFANFEKTINKIENELNNRNIKYVSLSKNYEINKIEENINKYKSGECKLLLLNAKYYGAGLNLQITNDIIIYHRFDKETEEQIIGRANRYGRTESLNVYYLLHDNENNNIYDNFNFNEIENINYIDWILHK